jgi:ribosome-binding factor A
MAFRHQRLAERILHEVSDIIQHRMKDPRKGWVTVTRVILSEDMRSARVYLSFLGDSKSENSEDISFRILRRAGGFIRTELGRRIRLRHVPELHFKIDHSIENSQRVMNILRDLHTPPAEPEEDPEADRRRSRLRHDVED